MNSHTQSVLTAVAAERARQDAKWGEQNHEPEVWLAILSEEVGELATAMLQHRFGAAAGVGGRAAFNDVEKEAVQVAAVAVALVECMRRWKEGEWTSQ